MIRIIFLFLIATVVVSTGCLSKKEETAVIVDADKDDNVVLDSIVIQTEEQLLSDYLKELESPRSSSKRFSTTDFSGRKINYSDVQPILKANCYACHNSKGNAPFSLMNYETVKKKSRAIADVLKFGLMPPWTADTVYSHFVNAPKMSDYDKSLVVHWAENSSVLGENQEVSDLTSEVPNLSIPAPSTYTVASNEDAYYYTVFDPKLSKDLKVEFIDYTQSNPRIVHHRTLFVDTTGVLLAKKRSQKEYESIINDLVPFTAWSKGMIPIKLTDNFYFNVPADSKFLLQTHYQGDGNIGQTDSFALNIYESASEGHQIDFALNNNFDILYKANEICTERVSMYVSDSISVTGIIPHMHYLVTKVECYAVIGDKKINLLKIPTWDYYFQGQYIFEKPIVIPAGATIYLSVVVDNSDKNKFQPNNPIRDVTYAQSSTEEMLTLVVLHTKSPVSDDLEIAKKLYK